MKQTNDIDNRLLTVVADKLEWTANVNTAHIGVSVEQTAWETPGMTAVRNGLRVSG